MATETPTPLPPDPYVHREVSGGEYMNVLLNQLRPGALNLLVSGELVPKNYEIPHGALEEPKILAIIGKLCNIHCHLQLTVSKDGKFVRYNMDDQSFQDSNYADVIIRRKVTYKPEGEEGANGEEVSEKHFQTHMNALTNELFDFSFTNLPLPPLLRVGVLTLSPVGEMGTQNMKTRYGLVIAVPHFISDLQGAATVFLDLALLIRGIPVQEPAPGVKAVSPPTALELVPKYRRGMFRFFFQGGLGAFKKHMASDPLSSFGPQTLPTEVRKGGIEGDGSSPIDNTSAVRFLSANHVASLLSETKKRSVKLTGVLMAANAIAHATLLQTHGNDKLKAHLASQAAKGHDKAAVRVNTVCPVDFRRRVTPPLTGIVAHMSYSVACEAMVNVNTKGKRDESLGVDVKEFWQVAEAEHAALHQQLEHEHYWWGAAIFDSMPQWLCKKMATSLSPTGNAKPSDIIFGIGNIGMVDDSNDRPRATATLKNVALFFHANPGFYLSAITTSTGMGISVTGTVNAETRNRHIDMVIAILMAVAGASS
eukprot:comp24136_c2_seq1/m.43884 comp24136_c2_seq1/g.43884  ORF comp24136_c2_seq1/g.43884 comp24136_c2_seq1/m.43884 type:complete len:537 (-) comp24136_c2_seq1:384-1994(-)